MKISNILIISTLLIFTGCSTKGFHLDMKTKAKETINKKTYKDYKKSYSEQLVEQKVKKQNYIDISREKSLYEVLKELETMSNKIYYLKSTNIILPKSRLKIKNIKDLNSYIEAIFDTRIEVIKKGDLSIVKLLSKNELKQNEIDKVKFLLDGEITVEELLKLITNVSSYEISIENNIEDVQAFQNSLITIKTKKLSDALSALSSSKNLYIDIDYDNKVINLKRYKDTLIELNIPMFEIASELKSESLETSGDSTVESKTTIAIFNELDKMLKSIIGDDKNSSYHIDKASGLIYIKATKRAEKSVRNIVKAYELSFSKEAVIEFERIELALNKDHESGIESIEKLKNAKTDINESITIGVGSKFSIVTDKLDITAKLNNSIGHVLNYGKNVIVLKNNMPTVQNMSLNYDYVQKISTTIDEDTNSTTTTAEIGTIKDGTSITARAKISRDKIFLNITPSIKKLVEIRTAKVGEDEIQLPKYNDQGYTISRELREGETIVVGSIITHDDANNYNGILPMEGFAIGGENTKNYIRREIVYAITLKSIKGF